MSVYNHDYIGSLVFVYDMDGESLIRTTISDYSKSEMSIKLTKWPSELEVGDLCKLLVLTEPSPVEFNGRIRQDYGKKYISLFRGKERESRGATRYKVNYKADIEALVVNKQVYPLYEYVGVSLLNISTSGMRIRTKKNTFNLQDRFMASVAISGNSKVLYARVVNMADVDDEHQDLGCSFYTPKLLPTDLIKKASRALLGNAAISATANTSAKASAKAN